MNNIVIPYTPSEKQNLFHASAADETFYGGAKGGGKSTALVADTLAYALEFPGAECYLFRETYDDLEANLIAEWKRRVPEQLYTYNESKHTAKLKNKSVVKFRYIRNKQDAEHYQGRSMDYIGVDELTKFEEPWIQELLSCLRSAKGFPPTFKATGNPGGIGHKWVKQKYITRTNYGKQSYTDEETGNLISFIPSTVYDNPAIMQNDPKYVRRLENLPEDKKKAFLYGDWGTYTGQGFPEWNPSIHVVDDFVVPSYWRKWRCCDNGYTDPFYWGWLTVSPDGIVYLYREYTRDYEDKKVIYSDQAARVAEMSQYQHYDENGNVVTEVEKYDFTVAGVDAWNQHHRDQTGKCLIDYYEEGGVTGFIKAVTDRKLRKDTYHEYLKPIEVPNGIKEQMLNGNPKKLYAKFQVFKSCKKFIEYMPELVEDEDDPDKIADCQWDHCLTGDTIVNTTAGDIPIKDMVGKSGMVHCYDEVTKCDAIGNYNNVRMTARQQPIYQIELEDGRTIKATAEHPVLTNHGWKKVIELDTNDEIVDIYRGMVKIKSIKLIGYEDVYNMEVEKYHNFSVNGGLIVHNCYDSVGYGIIAYHINRSKVPQEYSGPIEKHKKELIKKMQKDRKRSRFCG